MSLDVYLEEMRPAEVYWRSITHNLGQMAVAAGIYKHLWRPEELGIKTAGDLIEPLRQGLARLQADPERFEAHNPRNGWGDYEGFVEFVADYLRACAESPTATVRISR